MDADAVAHAAERDAGRLQPYVLAPLPAARRALDAGARRQAADLSVAAVDLRDQRQQLLQHRRQPRGVVLPAGDRARRPHDVGEGQAQPPVRRRAAALQRRDPQPVPPRRAFPVRRQHHQRHRQHARRLPARPAQSVRSGHRRVQGLRGHLRVGIRPGRLQGEQPVHVEPGRRGSSRRRRGTRRRAASSASRSSDYQNNVHSTMFPQAPRGETFRGDAGVPEDGTDPSVVQLRPARRLRVGHHRRRQDQPSRRRRRVLRPASGRRIGQRRRQRGAVQPPPVGDPPGGPVLRSVSRAVRLRPDHRRNDRHAAGDLPEAGADRNARRGIQDAGDLQLQPHLRARSDAGGHGARGLRRLAEPQRPLRRLVEPGHRHDSRRDHGQHRCAASVCRRRHRGREPAGAGSPSRTTTACS